MAGSRVRFQVDDGWIRRVLSVTVLAIVAAHVLAVGGGLSGAAAFDLRNPGAVANLVTVTLALAAVTIGARIAQKSASPHWRVATALIALAVFDAVAGTLGVRSTSAHLPDVVSPVAVALAAAGVAASWRRTRPAVLVAGLWLTGLAADPSSVVGRILCLSAAAIAVALAVQAHNRLSGLRARAQVRPQRSELTVVVLVAPGD